MASINAIQLINSKIFHDLGNIITPLGLLDESNVQSSLKIGIIDDILFKFKMLRQIFVEVDDDIDLSACYQLLLQYFNKKQVIINDFSNQIIQEMTLQFYQLFINVVICSATSISYYGDIKVNFNNDECVVQAIGKGTINKAIEDIINGENDDVTLDIKNIQAYFTVELAQKISLKLNCHQDKGNVVIGINLKR